MNDTSSFPGADATTLELVSMPNFCSTTAKAVDSGRDEVAPGADLSTWRDYEEIDTPHWEYPRTSVDDVIHWGRTHGI